MIRLILILIMSMTVSSCDYSMDMVWECASRAFRYHKECVTPRDLHRYVRLRASPLLRPTLLFEDGFMFQGLFRDCDKNKDKCISKEEALHQPACERNCKWKKAWVKTFCKV